MASLPGQVLSRHHVFIYMFTGLPHALFLQLVRAFIEIDLYGRRHH